MQRLPEDCMLDRMMAAGRVRPVHVRSLAERLAHFYCREAGPARVTADEAVERLQREEALNRQVFGALPWTRLDPFAVAGRYERALAAAAGLVRARVRAGRFVDGHGDLRPEHVCLLEPPLVIDCIAFSQALREVDPLDEIAFLGMACEMAGHAWIGDSLWTSCCHRLEDTPPPCLRPLYAARHAMLGARLALAHLLDPVPRTPERWRPATERLLTQAACELDRFGAA